MHPTPCTLLKSTAPGEKCGLVAFRSPSCPFVDIFFGRRGSASIPPPHQPSPGGSASATSPRGGSDSGVQTGNILYTINPERGRPPLGARASRPHLIPANNLPSTAAPLQSAPNPPLQGSLPSCQALCGRDARAPRGGPFDRLHCLHRLIREGCQRNERCEKSLQCTSSAMEADGLFVHQQRSDASLIPGIHTNGKLCFWNESPTLTAYLGWSSPGSAGVSPASLFLQTRGSLRLCQVLCGRDARVPGGAFDRLHCLHRLIREGCQRNERCEKSLQCTSSAMEADGLFVHQQRSDASLIPGIHTNGKLCFWNESPTLTAYLGWSSPGSAGVSPASLFLQTASQPRPLPRKVHQTRLYGVLFPRARLCAGETPAFPGGFCAGGTPALPGRSIHGLTPTAKCCRRFAARVDSALPQRRFSSVLPERVASPE